MSRGRIPKDTFDQALERLGRPPIEAMECAHKRVQQRLRSKPAVSSAEVGTDPPVDPRPASVWRLRQPVLIAATAFLAVALLSIQHLMNGLDTHDVAKSANGLLSRVTSGAQQPQRGTVPAATPFVESATSGLPAYEIASVKPNKSGGPRSYLVLPGGLNVTNMSLKELVKTAYRVKDFQIEGGPKWFDSDAYNIEARAARVVSNEHAYLMFQALLADRFQVKLHRETRQLPTYHLVIAKNGHKMKDATAECTAPGPRPSCGIRGPEGRLIGKRTMPQLATQLSGYLGRIVVDKTSLQGIWEFKLEWIPDSSRSRAVDAPADLSGPSLFTALQEQLGLRLASQRGPVEIIVIDSAERPSEN